MSNKPANLGEGYNNFDYDVSRNVRKAKMQSAKLQYVYPDENIRGNKNSGIINQYPYFAPDKTHLKRAPKMTEADELYLKKFLMARDLKDESKIEYTNIYEKQFIDTNKDGDKNNVQDGGTNVSIDINSRLFLERNRQFKPEQVSYID